jgi:phosphoglycolate phosphatase
LSAATPPPAPNPSPTLLHACSSTGVEPGCLYIGDDIRDIHAGKAAGMGTVAAAYGYLGSADPSRLGGRRHHPAPTRNPRFLENR